jgi:FlaA1/EpsC-like NDP-sugar epimerase
LALPSISRSQRKVILEKLSKFAVHVKTIPNMPDIISGESVDSLRDVEPEDLLGRDPVPADPILLTQSITNKSVLVSGAGGSIGSEICRQIIKNNPKLLVLYEVCEFALYTIEKELQGLASSANQRISIYPVLGNVLDDVRVRRVIEHFDIETIYHAAAYKNKSLVEHNFFEGIRNNSFGTKVIADAAKAKGVERFVLISTDKAVRPTNVMGATKRLAELILQNLSVDSEKTVFSMVRFGNVLGSSGSVVPLFRQQINEGGPVTVTHPEITRFFMTIPEAASLVIQAGSMAEGGDVFVLDMGQPVKITELAERMIKLMGFDIKSAESPEGIEINYTGLRPGEKLYEELLIGEDVIGTDHSKIMRAEEERLSCSELQALLVSIARAIENEDSQLARSLLERSVAGFKPSSPVVDWLLKPEGENPPLH